MKGAKPVGLTKDVGWEFGLRKTFPYPQAYLWDFMFSDKGLKAWLGELQEELELKKAYRTAEGIEGMVTVLVPYSHIRMKWKKKSWTNTSMVQVRIMGDTQKGIISFLQDKLLSNDQREEMRVYWNEKMAAIERALE